MEVLCSTLNQFLLLYHYWQCQSFYSLAFSKTVLVFLIGLDGFSIFHQINMRLLLTWIIKLSINRHWLLFWILMLVNGRLLGYFLHLVLHSDCCLHSFCGCWRKKLNDKNVKNTIWFCKDSLEKKRWFYNNCLFFICPINKNKILQITKEHLQNNNKQPKS